MSDISSIEELKKLNSIDDLKKLYWSLFEKIKNDDKPQLVICSGTACQASGTQEIIRGMKKYIIENSLQNKINLKITGCHGFCEMGPFILTKPGDAFYHKVTVDAIPKIINASIKGELVEELLYRDPKSGEIYYKQHDIPFFNKQQRTILAKNQNIDPIRIVDYFTNFGYKSLEKVLSLMTPQQVLEQVKISGIRGRGGAGFPTGLKWEYLSKQSNEKGKYLVCNADEGDPGAYMDRSVLEGNPHSIIEGMLIGAFATGATNGVVYVRNEYPLAIKHLMIALRQSKDIGLLGDNILGTKFSFDIKIVRGAGAFVCGEETALIKSIEGKMGEPKQRPPYPVEKGVYGLPTAINNVETWANIPIIIDIGGAEYAKIGTKSSTGTKIFSLVGKIKNTGLVEIPMGTTIKELVYDIGGGAPEDYKIKAIQSGGPSGGCIPVSLFDLPIDFEKLAEAGSIMGSGGMIVMDERTCMVDVAKYFMKFLKCESCGKCFTCRKGTQRMYEILDDITKGRATLDQLDLLEELALVVKDTTMCGLGQTAANPVLSTLRYFRDEFIDHIKNKHCKAGVCKDIVGAPCQATCPIGTEAWRYIAHIARGEYEEAYIALRDANPFPSVCARVCSHPCEKMCRAGAMTGEPVAIRALKRFITDMIEPSIYKPVRKIKSNADDNKVAVIGAGPAGLTAAHKLSLMGYKVTVFEKDAEPGGMLISGIPEYRLPRKILKEEIKELLDENISLKCNTALGRDITIDNLLNNGYKAIFLGMGAHKSKLLNIEGEDLEGVFPAIEFLKAFNIEGQKLAHGRVGVIGGGDSAIDAARVALRQKIVEKVTIFYRRTRNEMPALQHEIDAALEEGIELHTLVSPVKIKSDKGKLTGVEFIKNKLGDVDASGRRNPEAIKGSEYTVPLDNLIVTIGDTPDVGYISYMGIEVNKWGTLIVNEDTLETNRPGVFAGGDVVTGPNTVVEAIAAGKKAAIMIDRYLNGEELGKPLERKMPTIYVPPREVEEVENVEEMKRIKLPTISVEKRKSTLEEVEITLTEESAIYEASRCMRCDLDFTYAEKIKREQEEFMGDIMKSNSVPEGEVLV
ncbi:MAG: FAD-dependent oxidoreductase [Ignavibacteriae bacterium]|nr:FAD-dependent oxidoreductase [Ignavibacteriota bacterium]